MTLWPVNIIKWQMFWFKKRCLGIICINSCETDYASTLSIPLVVILALLLGTWLGKSDVKLLNFGFYPSACNVVFVIIKRS